MQAYDSPVPSDFSASHDAESKPTINFVIVSEDLPCGVLAKHLYDELVDQMEGQLAFTYEVWPFRGLKDPHLRELATRDATEADILIFAVSGREDLPMEVKSWMQTWLGLSDKTGALVMLSDQDHGSEQYTESVRSYLQDAAARTGLEFLTNTKTSGGEERENSLAQNISFREPAPSTPAKGTSFRASPQWGLNE
jgi:hypothetical protein